MLNLLSNKKFKKNLRSNNNEGGVYNNEFILCTLYGKFQFQ